MKISFLKQSFALKFTFCIWFSLLNPLNSSKLHKIALLLSSKCLHLFLPFPPSLPRLLFALYFTLFVQQSEMHLFTVEKAHEEKLHEMVVKKIKGVLKYNAQKIITTAQAKRRLSNWMSATARVVKRLASLWNGEIAKNCVFFKNAEEHIKFRCCIFKTYVVVLTKN